MRPGPIHRWAVRGGVATGFVGTTRFGSGWEEARDTFDSARRYDAGDGGVPRPVPGLGSEAFAETRSEAATSGAGVRGGAEVTALLGRDVLTVDYAAEPSSPERARQAAVAVAKTVLGEL